MPKKQDEKDKTQRKYVYYSIVYNFHSQSNIKNDFLKALSVLSCKHKKQIGNWLTLMLNNASNSCMKIAKPIFFDEKEKT